MRLEIFIKPRNRTLRKIKQLLERAGKKTHFREKAEKRQIVIYGGCKANNFKYTAHELWQKKRPDWTGESPFLIRAGSDWSRKGLVSILRNYINFRLPFFRKSHFPDSGDFNRPAYGDEDLLNRLVRMKKTAENCPEISKEDFRAIRKIISDLGSKSAGQAKKEVLYYFMDSGKITLPWGNPPTSKKGRDKLIKWLEVAHEAYPRYEGKRNKIAPEVALEWLGRLQSSPIRLT